MVLMMAYTNNIVTKVKRASHVVVISI